MKILMLTPYLPYPPSSGGQIRSYNLIKQLSKTNNITLYSLIKNQEEKKYIKNLEQYCSKVKVFERPKKPWTINNIIKTGLSSYPFVVIRNMSSEEKKDVAKVLQEEQFDIIHAETFYVCPQIPDTNVPIVLVDQTIEYQVYQHYVEIFKWPVARPILSLDVLKIKYWESYYWKKADKVVAVSESDAKKMSSLVANLDVAVVPNGVGEDLMVETSMHYSQQILFMGNYEWMQNTEAALVLAKNVFPLIVKEIPAVKLVIAGQHTEKVASLASDKVRLVNLEIEDVDSVRRIYQESGILVAPLYGPGGTRLKILGAMAAKLPVVTTNVGIEGIDAKNGEAVLYGNNPQELAQLAIKVLQDKSLYKQIADRARKLVEEKYAYPAIAQKLDAIYHEVRSQVKKN